LASDLAARVHAFVRTVPRGRVVTYADAALAVGTPGGARSVGGVMAATTDKRVPCHRVVRSDGRVTGPSAKALAAALRREGVEVDASGRIAGFQQVRWSPA
jgi:O-6-methylguanine DNA methyltransferase